jgi:hypothetical protein
MNISEQPADNPLLRHIPTVAAAEDAISAAQTSRSRAVAADQGKDPSKQRPADRFIADESRRRIIAAVVEQVRSSYAERDIRDPDYRNFIITANTALHRRQDRRRRAIPLVLGEAPHAKARGILVAAPVRTGRRSLADAIESLFTRRPVTHCFPACHPGFMEFVQLPMIRILWPIDGRVETLARDFIIAVDSALKTDYACKTSTPMFPDRDMPTALRALAITTNLGLLMVERINMADACARRAASVWQALNEFTKMTGIPVLCLATPGATVASLANHSDVFSPLARFEILPSARHTDNFWLLICESLYGVTVGTLRRGRMPKWLPRVAFRLTLGYPGLLAKALTSIALMCRALKIADFTQQIFTSYAKQALVLEQCSLSYIALVRARNCRIPPSLRLHGDWLSLQELQSNAPSQRPSMKSGGPPC